MSYIKEKFGEFTEKNLGIQEKKPGHSEEKKWGHCQTLCKTMKEHI